MPKVGKYEPAKLIAMFRLAATLRKQMLGAGFTDNGGAIHSAERILNILGLRLCYPGLSHINNLRHHPNAEFSTKARAAHKAGEKVLIEHVRPHRALTRLAIEQIEAGASDDVFEAFVKESFQLALLTREETLHLNNMNRSKINPDRLKTAGIRLAKVRSASMSQVVLPSVRPSPSIERTRPGKPGRASHVKR